MPVSARQLEAWHPLNVTGNARNPIAFTEGKQAEKQQQPVGLHKRFQMVSDGRPMPMRFIRYSVRVLIGPGLNGTFVSDLWAFLPGFVSNSVVVVVWRGGEGGVTKIIPNLINIEMAC